MHQEEITALFDQQAASYDEKWSRLAPLNGALHLLTSAVLAPLPETARILCVGAGTGNEILHLAEDFPDWEFTAVEPSAAMLAELEDRAEEAGISWRCTLHNGYLDSLPTGEPFDAATSFLVSQFILERDVRTKFFRSIADRLRPGAVLISSDLAGDLASPEGRSLLETWMHVMKGGGLTAQEAEKMREVYSRDVAVLPPGMIHAWHSKRALS
jgi:tRNA (cmo5U34)-methyltransferase